jgi:hypothetical protein
MAASSGSAASAALSDQCKSIDRGIVHYRDIASRLTDLQTLKGIDVLIAKMKDEKRRLHPEELP